MRKRPSSVTLHQLRDVTAGSRRQSAESPNSVYSYRGVEKPLNTAALYARSVLLRRSHPDA